MVIELCRRRTGDRPCSPSACAFREASSIALRDPKKRIQSRADQFSTIGEKRFISFDLQVLRIDWNALRFECLFPGLFQQLRKILAGRFVADLPIGLAANKSKIGNVTMGRAAAT